MSKSLDDRLIDRNNILTGLRILYLKNSNFSSSRGEDRSNAYLYQLPVTRDESITYGYLW